MSNLLPFKALDFGLQRSRFEIDTSVFPQLKTGTKARQEEHQQDRPNQLPIRVLHGPGVTSSPADGAQ